jgi:large subunit ribosomal protein L18
MMTSKIARRKRIRAKIVGTAQRPRISVFKSNKYIYLQAIDDQNFKTLAAVDSRKKDYLKDFSTKLINSKINRVVFDRSGYKYHGRIKQIADGLRELGLKF